MGMVDKAVSGIGKLEEWEREELQKSSRNFGHACYHIAEIKQTSIQRTMKWLKMSAKEGNQEGALAYHGLLYGLNPDLQYTGDETALWVKTVKQKFLLKKFSSFVREGSRPHRHLIRTLLSGSLSKNQDTALYRSFFGSGLAEGHMFPLISKYLMEEEKREDENVHVVRASYYRYVSTLSDISRAILCNTSSIITLKIIMTFDNQFLCFLPLLFSCLPKLKDLTFKKEMSVEPKHVDLSLLQQADTSKLEALDINRCSYTSLSPLSLCDLSSLHTLYVFRFPGNHGIDALNGLSSDITRSLKRLTVMCCDLKDISTLSDCDLSSLEGLDLSGNRSLSDLSPLRGSDLSSLKYLNLGFTDISDLSPLCECKGLALEELDLRETAIEDLSTLSLLDLSRLKEPIQVQNSKVSDLSPLENIPYDGVKIWIRDTPIMEAMKERETDPSGTGTESITVGKVTVGWACYW